MNEERERLGPFAYRYNIRELPAPFIHSIKFHLISWIEEAKERMAPSLIHSPSSIAAHFIHFIDFGSFINCALSFITAIRLPLVRLLAHLPSHRSCSFHSVFTLFTVRIPFVLLSFTAHYIRVALIPFTVSYRFTSLHPSLLSFT